MSNPSDERLATLGHLNHLEFAREMARSSGRHGTVEERDGLLLCASGTTFPVLYNSCWRLDDAAPAAAVIEQADAWFRERGRGWSLTCRVPAEGSSLFAGVDDDLVAAAEAAGLVSLLHPPEMVCRTRLADDGARPLPAGAELRWVEDQAGLDDFVSVSATAYASLGLPVEVIPEACTSLAAFTLPHVHTVVAHLDGAPVAAAQTILSHGVAGVYTVGTVEAARGTGLGEAVTRAVTNRAFDLGATANTLQASPMGEPIYARMGYETLFRYHTLVRFV